jgi:hypothetical protein
VYALQRFSVLKEVIDDHTMFVIMVTVFMIFFINNLRVFVVDVAASYSMLGYSLKGFVKNIAVMIIQSLIFQVGTTVIGSALLFKNFDDSTKYPAMSANDTGAEQESHGVSTERKICACTLFLSGCTFLKDYSK